MLVLGVFGSIGLVAVGRPMALKAGPECCELRWGTQESLPTVTVVRRKDRVKASCPGRCSRVRGRSCEGLLTPEANSHSRPRCCQSAGELEAPRAYTDALTSPRASSVHQTTPRGQKAPHGDIEKLEPATAACPA